MVPCIRFIASATDLIAEAEELWAAERNQERESQISAGWGCAALLCNPDSKIPQNLLRDWANRIRQERTYGNVPQTADEGCLVSDQGLLHIPWPRVVEYKNRVPLDLLLATATHPTLEGTPPSYPSVDIIANAWTADSEEHVDYFWRNYESSIRTFQDEAIRERLPSR